MKKYILVAIILLFVLMIPSYLPVFSESVDICGQNKFHQGPFSYKNQINPSCTENGSQDKYCDTCGEFLYQEIIGAKGHIWRNLIIIQEPSDSANGIMSQTCIVCGETEYVSLDNSISVEANYSDGMLNISGNVDHYYIILLDGCDIGRYISFNSSSVSVNIDLAKGIHIITIFSEITEKYSATSIFIGDDTIEQIPEVHYCLNSLVHQGSLVYLNHINPTCTQNGSQDVLCEACGQLIYSQTIYSHRHVYNNSDDFLCSICGERFNFSAHYENGTLTISAESVDHYYMVLIDGNDTWRSISPNLPFYSTNITLSDGIHFATIDDDMGTVFNAYFLVGELIPKFELPSSLITITDEAFQGISASSIGVPDSVTSIGSRAFADCKNLTCIVLGENVSSIAADAFEGSPNVVAVVPNVQSVIDAVAGTGIPCIVQ